MRQVIFWSAMILLVILSFWIGAIYMQFSHLSNAQFLVEFWPFYLVHSVLAIILIISVNRK